MALDDVLHNGSGEEDEAGLVLGDDQEESEAATLAAHGLHVDDDLEEEEDEDLEDEDDDDFEIPEDDI